MNLFDWLLLYYIITVIASATFFYFRTRWDLRNGYNFTVGDLLVYSVWTLIPLLNSVILFCILVRVTLDSDFWYRPLIRGDGK